MKKSLEKKISQLDLLQQSNSFMYFLYNSFLFRKFFHSDLVQEYEAKEGVELAFNAYNFFRKLTKKIIYLMGIYVTLDMVELNCFGLLLMLLTIAGSIIRDIINFDVRAYNNVILMHVDPRQYAVSVINRYLISESLTMGVAFLGVSWYIEVSYPVCMVFILMYLSIHLIGEVVHVYWYVRNDYVKSDNRIQGWLYGAALLVIGVLVYLSLTGRMAVSNGVAAWGGLLIIPLGLFAYVVLRGDINYSRFYRYNLSMDEINGTKDVVVNTGRSTVNLDSMSRNMVSDSIKTDKKGYDFLFTAFITRYKKTFLQGLIVKMIVITVVGAVLIAVPFIKDLGLNYDGASGLLKTESRIFIYVVYWFAQAGKNFIVTCFMQIDRFLVHYNFFRKSDAIAKNYRMRVKVATIITLIPSLYMLLMIALICIVHSLDIGLGQLAVLFIFVIVLSVFYSIYNISAYYLMQPYGFDGQIVNKAYTIVDIVIYVIVYMSFEIEFTLSAPILAALVITLSIISAVLYAAVVKRAPSNFRVR